MRILEFVDKYCQDLIQEYRDNIDIIDFTQFQYDEIIVDENGKKTPVVYVDNIPVPVRNFIEMKEDEFTDTYKTPNSQIIYTRYCETLEILEGKEFIEMIRNKMKQESMKVKEEAIEYDQV